MLTKEELEKIFKDAQALLEGHFCLSSGMHSDRYIQCAKVLQFPSQTEKLCQQLASRFQDQPVDVVVGPAMGGIVLAYEMAKQLGVRGIFAERENGVMRFRRGFAVFPGEKVLVVEDVVTTGGSVLEVMDLVRQAGGEVLGVAVLVDRSGGKVDLGVPLQSLLTLEVQAFKPENCPLCQQNMPLEKPGSRFNL